MKNSSVVTVMRNAAKADPAAATAKAVDRLWDMELRILEPSQARLEWAGSEQAHMLPNELCAQNASRPWQFS